MFAGDKRNRARALDATSGRLLWSINTDATVARSGGDVQAIRFNRHDGNVYVGHHDSVNSVNASKLHAVDAVTGVVDTDFVPLFDRFWGPFAIDVAPGRVVVGGGSFTTVSGVRAMNVAFF